MSPHNRQSYAPEASKQRCASLNGTEIPHALTQTTAFPVEDADRYIRALVEDELGFVADDFAGPRKRCLVCW